MSAPRIKRKNKTNGSNVVPIPEGPLDWVRTDDKSMVDCLYVLGLTRGLPAVLEALQEAVAIEARACRGIKAQFNPAFERDAEFLEQVRRTLSAVVLDIEQTWVDGEDDEPSWARRKNTAIGAMYPLPHGGIYVPKR